jgi:hypothetical protein
MNEQDWLTSTDPEAMLEHLGHRADPRKLRLFGCACCRRIWPLLTDSRSKLAVEVAEAFADGNTTERELKDAAREAWRAVEFGAASLAAITVGESTRAAADVAGHARESLRAAAGATARAVALKVLRVVPGTGGHTVGPAGSPEREIQANLVRCVFGNPFNPPTPIPAHVREWNGATVVKLAEAVYEERAWDRLRILADALEEAGCTDSAILDHCRHDQHHARGCWVLDAIGGMS